MSISFDQQVVIVTGAAQGLGRSYALELARRGARVVVNDIAEEGVHALARKIKHQGGAALAFPCSVTDEENVAAMVEQVINTWGRVDVLINNAGMLRDKSFAKMEIADFRRVVEVHIMGSVICTKAVWNIMREQNYGRVVLTTSSSGLYGSFGQSNYAAAKTAMLGLMNTLVLEGEKYNVRVNCISPVAGTKMTQGLIPQALFKQITVEAVTAGTLMLCHKDSPNRMVLCAGGGGYARAQIFETDGIYLPEHEQQPEKLAENWEAICNERGQTAIQVGHGQLGKFMQKAAAFIKNHQ